MKSSQIRKPSKKLPFDAQVFLDSAGVPKKIIEYRKAEAVYSQGQSATAIFYIQKGGIRLSTVNRSGKEAVVGMLGPGDFFGEGCLAGQSVRIGTATAVTDTTVLSIEKEEMTRLLHTEHDFSDRFMVHMLSRNIRIEEDLVDQLFNSIEKRLARTLLLLARFGSDEQLRQELPRISQETLAEMIGTTRSRVNFFMNKFRKMGFIEYTGAPGALHINSSLLNIVLHD